MKLGILGGMGPMATADFFKKVIEMTNASKDQEHIHVIIDSNTEIPDRTSFILNKGENPRMEMIKTATKLEIMGAEAIAMPCNTAHFFYNDISDHISIPFINMIDETAKYLNKNRPEDKQFVLLATTGTYASGVYEEVFDQYGLSILQPDDALKEIVMEWIYQVKAGTINADISSVQELIKIVSNGVEMPVILGCTELPVLVQALQVEGVFIDPTSVLAKACVEFSSIHDKVS